MIETIVEVLVILVIVYFLIYYSGPRTKGRVTDTRNVIKMMIWKRFYNQIKFIAYSYVWLRWQYKKYIPGRHI